MAGQKTLVQFGAGNIGRSLVGQLFSLAGWRVVFVDVFEPVIDALNARQEYRVVVKDDLLPGEPASITVKNVSGINLADRTRVLEELVTADMVGTSVGAANMEGTCSVLAEALPLRTAPLPVLLCENLHDASTVAYSHMGNFIKPDSCRYKIHFIEAAISKMVPIMPKEVRQHDPLVVWAEAYNTLYLDAEAYPGTPPVVPGVAWRGDFPAYVDRKLFLHNFGHAAAAYVGNLSGKHYIWECMEDKNIRETVSGCMMESAKGLALRYANIFTFDENRAWADDLLRRFENRSLGDTVFRVGRDLKRKLAPNDRCIGTLRMLGEMGVDYSHTVKSIAAALRFDAKDEDGNALPGDQEIVKLAANNGPEHVLINYCGLDQVTEHDLIERISAEYRDMDS